MIEVFIPSLDPKYDNTLMEIAKACRKLPQIPVDVFAFSIEDALRGNAARAKRELFKWADGEGIVRHRKTYAPLLWTLHEDGLRHIGMAETEPSVRIGQVFERASWAHYEETVFLDFANPRLSTNDPRVSWGWYGAFPSANPRLFAELYRRAKQPVVACSKCGCTEYDACVTTNGTCSWVKPTLCSACHNPKTRLRGPLVARRRKKKAASKR